MRPKLVTICLIRKCLDTQGHMRAVHAQKKDQL